MKKILSLITRLTILVLIISIFGFDYPVIAADLGNGAKIFDIHCAGCHSNGGNIVRRGKNLKLKALKQNSVNSVEAIAFLVTNGKNNMSAYKDRLTEQEIQDVSTYVLEQAQKDWH